MTKQDPVALLRAKHREAKERIAATEQALEVEAEASKRHLEEHRRLTDERKAWVLTERQFADVLGQLEDVARRPWR
jgi:Na+/phosphate symporter